MAIISLCGLPVCRYGDPRNIQRNIQENSLDASIARQHLQDWDYDRGRPGAAEHYLRGVFAPPMDILPIDGHID